MNVIRRPTEAIVDLNALRHNCRLLKKASRNSEIMAVVKADAYGHGATQTVKALKKEGVKHFGVALVEEGIRLREAGIKDRIYVLSGISKGEEEALFQWDLVPLVTDLETIVRLSRLGKRFKKKAVVHIKVDTGMGRLGILPWEANIFLKKIKSISGVEIEGLASHFATLGDDGMLFAKEQLRIFNSVVAKGITMGLRFRWIHISNSAGVFLLPSCHFNMVRPGIALYGYQPSKKCRAPLKPVMELKSRIIYLKWVPKGYTISYGRTFTASRDSLIATVPIGYADGINRLLSNRGEMLVRGRRCPIAGRVCMDLTMIDVTGVDGVKVGDEVVIIGRQGKNSISALEIADRIGTISYEVLCSISQRVPRRYINSCRGVC